MMNPEKGELEPLKEGFLNEVPTKKLEDEFQKRLMEGYEQSNKTLWDVFTVGEIVIVKNSYFRVHDITNKRLILRPQRVSDS